MSAAIVMVGRTFGLWRVVGQTSYWCDVICACGFKSVVRSDALRAGKSSACQTCAAQRAAARRKRSP